MNKVARNIHKTLRRVIDEDDIKMSMEGVDLRYFRTSIATSSW